MKRTLFMTFILIMFFSCIALSAQEGQVFNVSVDYPDHGTIGSAGNAIDAYGTVTVPVGGYARFYLTGYFGYEPAGFNVNGQYKDSGLYEYKVEQVTSPIVVIGTFLPVQDAVGPVLNIVVPSRSSIVKTAADNTVSIAYSCSGEEETNPPVVELFKNGALLPNQPVKNPSSYYIFDKLPLDEGDNLFMVRAHDNVSYDNYAADFVLVHYSSIENTDMTRAVILVDSRLFSQPGIGDKLTQYASLAASAVAPTDFIVSIEDVNGIDDWSTDQVKSYIADLKNVHKALEGVLLVGNIKLPSFAVTREGVRQSRLFTQKYEDLDSVLRNSQGSQADYDSMEKGANPFPELWCAVMPVGIDNLPEHNTYEAFAAQLNPYLDKLVSRYSGWSASTTFYQLSDRLWDLNNLWYVWSSSNITFNSINNTGLGPYNWYTDVTPDMFYRPMETWRWGEFSNANRYYRSLPPIGKGWQSKDIYKDQMMYNNYGIVWTNADSSETESVITTAEAKSLSGGGTIQLATGNSVGGFKQYGSSSYVDTAVYPDGNILCGYAYGTSAVLAALGCPFNQGHESLFEKLAAYIAQGDYVGKAHYFRKCLQYQGAGGSPADLANNTQEILIGDPFAKLGYDDYEIDVMPPTVPQNVVCTNIESMRITIQWDPCTDEMGLSGYYCKAADSYGYEIWVYVSPNDTSCTIEGLDPNTTYTITVQSFDDWGNMSDWSSPIKVTTLDAVRVQAPQGFTCTGKTDTTVDLVWNAVSSETGILAYEVSFKGPDGYDSRWQIWDGTNLASLGGLYPETTYTLRVRAIDSNYIPGLWSDSLSIATNPAIPPSVPQNLVVTQVTESSVSLSWEPSIDDTGVNGYEVQYIWPTGDVWATWTTENSITIDYLNSNSRYLFNIRSYDTSGNYSDWTPTLAVTTNPATPPTVPQNLVATDIGGSYVSFSWDASSDDTGIAYYIVKYTGVDGYEDLIQAYYYTSVTIYNLEPETTYTFRIQAFDFIGNASNWSSPVTVTTLPVIPPTVPTNLVATDIGVDYITIGWDPSMDDTGISYYSIVCTGSDETWRPYTSTDTQATFTGLTPGVEYTLQVQAMDTEYNWSELSDPLIVTTLSLPPGWTPVPASLGDVNGNGSIDIVDALIIAQYYVGINPSGFILSNADVNNDGIVDIVDSLLISQYYVGLLYPWPPTNSTPAPTPVPNGDVGKVWINPASQSVDSGASVTIEIHANTGSAALGAFGFTLTYPTNLFTFGYIAEITSGLMLTNNTNTAGTIVTAGFNPNGIAGSVDLALIRITLTASSSESGSGSIGLAVGNLNDTAGYVIGSPSATGGTVTVSAGDETPPTIPQNLVATDIGVDYITIGWDPSTDDTGIGYYLIACTGADGTYRSYSTTDTQVFVTGLTPGVEYTFTVQAYDTANNWSEWTDPLVVSTLDPPPEWTPTPAPTPMTTPGITALPGLTPNPTPLPVLNVGQAWISPASQSVNQGASVYVEIHASTGSTALGAFGFTLTYPTNLFTFDSITEITSGFNLTTNTNTAGTIVSAGFNANGIAGSTDLALIGITLTASSSSSGTGTIGLSVVTLSDIGGNAIGTPSGIGGTVTVNVGGTTAQPGATPSAVPVATPSAGNTTTTSTVGTTTTSANSTTTSAGHTTTSAGHTTTSAGNTTTSAGSTTTSAGNTTTSAGNTTTSAGNTTTTSTGGTAAPGTTPTPMPTLPPADTPAPPVNTPATTPTAKPTITPTTAPTVAPTTAPTPTAIPTITPTTVPTTAPTTVPTIAPTTAPTLKPTATPKPHSTHKPTLAPLPDLADLSPTEILVKGDLKAGSAISLDSGVANKGKKDSGKFEVMWSVNYMSVIDSGTHANVPAGATVMNGNSAATWTPKRAGKYVIAFILDPCNKVKESNERNNVVYKTIYIKK